eukprot:jgi/Tetstr1/465343/TSEL_010029.t1
MLPMYLRVSCYLFLNPSRRYAFLDPSPERLVAMDRAVAEQPQELNYQREQEQMQHEQEPPASSAAMHDAMHGPLLAATLAFLDLDALASAALCCRDWYRAIHRDDTMWKMLAEVTWPPELLHVAPPGLDSSIDAMSIDEAQADDMEEMDGEEDKPYASYRQLVLDRNARFAVPCIPLDVKLAHARRSMASPRRRQYWCHLQQLIWDRRAGELRMAFEVEGDAGKVRMPVTTFLFRRILDESGNKYDDINVAPLSRTDYVGESGKYRGVIAWKAEDIFAANASLNERCEHSQLIAKVPSERVSGVRLSLCFGLPCQGPVAVVGTMMDQGDPSRPLDIVTGAQDVKTLDAVFLSRFDDAISYRAHGASDL